MVNGGMIILGDDRSEAITSDSPYETWIDLSLNATVPVGTFKVEIGGMLTRGTAWWWSCLF